MKRMTHRFIRFVSLAALFLFVANSHRAGAQAQTPTDASVPAPANVAAPRTKADWTGAHQRLSGYAQRGTPAVLFVGDSITEYWLSPDKGLSVWKEHYAPKGYGNIGIAGDKTQNILWRLQNGGLGNLKPKVIVLLAGINNIKADNTPKETAEGVKAIVSEIRSRLPTARILLLGVFPTWKANLRDKIRQTNDLITQLADGQNVSYLDIGDVFLQQDGSLKAGVMVDGLHPSTEGYRLWAEAMQSKLGKLAE